MLVWKVKKIVLFFHLVHRKISDPNTSPNLKKAKFLIALMQCI